MKGRTLVEIFLEDARKSGKPAVPLNLVNTEPAAGQGVLPRAPRRKTEPDRRGARN